MKENSIFKEINGFRNKKKTKGFTEEQNRFIKECRKFPPVSYPNMVILWAKAGWGDVGQYTLRNQAIRLKCN